MKKKEMLMVASEVTTKPRVVITAEQVSFFPANGTSLVLGKEEFAAAIKIQQALALNRPQAK